MISEFKIDKQLPTDTFIGRKEIHVECLNVNASQSIIFYEQVIRE